MKAVVILLFALIEYSRAEITWNEEKDINWSSAGCDFSVENSIKKFRASREHCGAECVQTNACTHFTWTRSNGDNCFLIGGKVSTRDAFKAEDKNRVCGIIVKSKSTRTASTTRACGLLKNGKLGVGIQYDAIGQVNLNDYDYITIWLNQPVGVNGSTDFIKKYHGAMLEKCKSANKMPAFYAYVIAFEARSKIELEDCDFVSSENSLCTRGACFIQNNRDHLVRRYSHQAREIAKRYGTDRPVLFLMEPDYWQYFGDSKQKCKLDMKYARDLFRDFVAQIKKHLPRAIISWDISPWLDQNTMKDWWSTFAECKECSIEYINMSGGQAHADSPQIRPNELTYSFMSQLTGRKIISDCGYGIGGQPDGSCRNWQNQNNLNNRINDGVVAISVANPVDGTYPRLQLKC